MDLHAITSLFCALTTALIAAVTDARTGKIPNWLTFGSLGLALLWHAGLWQGKYTAEALLGLLAGGFIPLVSFLWSRGRAIGGGDVKLLAALGAWLGPELVLHATVSGLLLILLYALWKRRRGEIRLGPGLCAGTFLAVGLQFFGAWA